MINTRQMLSGDCLELMPKIPAQSIDMILCDLPYGITRCRWDTVIPLDILWDQYERIIKPGRAIVLTASQPFTSILVSSNLSWFKYELIWEKSKASNFLSAKSQPLKVHENILVFGKGRLKYNPQMTVGKPFKGAGRSVKGSGWGGINKVPNPTYRNDNPGQRYPRSVQYFKTAESEKNGALHPSQKPLALFEYLIRTYTDQGDLVLDNCMGSGTTAVCCRNLQRSFIGMEQDENFFKIACNRLPPETPTPLD